MVLDASAVLALLLEELDAAAIARAIESDPVRAISSVTWLECQIVLRARKRERGTAMAESFFRETQVLLIPFDAQHAHAALAAWERYGKGRHPAGLNFGDCCAYATALLRNQPLLFKGSDFSATDVARVEY